MGRGFVSIEAKGLKDVLKSVKGLGGELVEDLDGEFEASALSIVRSAKRRVPKDTGLQGNSISYKRNDLLDYEIVVQRFYAAFVEFGTGTKVDVPAGLEDYAMQFYRGPGVNLPPHPFLFPAYEEERKKLVEKVKKIISTYKI